MSYDEDKKQKGQSHRLRKKNSQGFHFQSVLIIFHVVKDGNNSGGFLVI